MKLPAVSVNATGVLAIAGALVVLYIIVRGPKAAAKDAAKGAVGLAGAVVTGTVDGVSEAIGIPTTDDTTTDPRVARYIIDHPDGGYWAASAWAGVPALVQGAAMPAWSGSPPPAGTKLARRFPADAYLRARPIDFGTGSGWDAPSSSTPSTGDFARADRLLTPLTTTTFNGA
jgi:hypothetical protein